MSPASLSTAGVPLITVPAVAIGGGSLVRPGDTRPSKLIWLTAVGGACLADGALILGVGLV
jgi:hypothetical protein